MVFAIRELQQTGAANTAVVLRAAIAPDTDTDTDNAIMTAMRVGRQHQMMAWREALFAHRNHGTFFLADDPRARQFGFVCSCTGTDQEWRIPVTALQDALPETREAVLRVRDRYMQRLGVGSRKTRHEKRRADAKARALLHRFLTKSQRWDLRATESFRVRGQDGNIYVLTKKWGHSIYMMENGIKRYTFCLVPTGPLPLYDLMLAHKVMIECDLWAFYEKAHVTDNRTGKWHASGLALLEEPVEDPGPIPLAPPTEETAGQVIPIMRADLEDPGPWLRQQAREAGVHLPEAPA